MSDLVRIAKALGRSRRKAKRGRRIPSLWLITDPQRLPDPLPMIETLPPGAGVIFRAFGAPDAGARARSIGQAARRRDLVFLIGADADLARSAGADGVHLPERLLHMAPRLRRARPQWLITGAAHGRRALALANRLGLDAIFLSAVFESRSPSAGTPLGPVRFAAFARGSSAPVIALGGVSAKTAARLVGSGAGGLAAVEGLAGPAIRT